MNAAEMVRRQCHARTKLAGFFTLLLVLDHNLAAFGP